MYAHKYFHKIIYPQQLTTKSFIIGANHDIDVVLLTTDPSRHFFDQDTGIYVFGPEGTYDTNIPYYGANFWEDWERPVHFSYHENGTDRFAAFNAGVKIFGGWSRGQNGQRSLSRCLREVNMGILNLSTLSLMHSITVNFNH